MEWRFFPFLCSLLFSLVFPLIKRDPCPPFEPCRYAYQIANGQRPDLNPAMAPAEVNQIIDACWNGIASMRPSASEVVRMLKEVQAKGAPSWNSTVLACLHMHHAGVSESLRR